MLLRPETREPPVYAVGGITLPNPASVRLHESLGFKHVGTFKEVGRKFDTWHDTSWWQVMLE